MDGVQSRAHEAQENEGGGDDDEDDLQHALWSSWSMLPTILDVLAPGTVPHFGVR